MAKQARLLANPLLVMRKLPHGLVASQGPIDHIKTNRSDDGWWVLVKNKTYGKIILFLTVFLLFLPFTMNATIMAAIDTKQNIYDFAGLYPMKKLKTLKRWLLNLVQRGKQTSLS